MKELFEIYDGSAEAMAVQKLKKPKENPKI